MNIAGIRKAMERMVRAKDICKKRKGLLRLVMTGIAAAVIGAVIAAGNVAAQEEKECVSILFTHDMHSHINSFDTVENGEDINIGGFARIRTIIKEQRKKDPETLFLDGGDFSMGTLFQTVYETQAAELRLLGAMDCEATTFGNHEFDFRSKGLIRMLETAVDSGEKLPALLVCNLDWTDMDEEQREVKEAFDLYGVRDYQIVEKNGVRIALIGVFGEDALACAPTCALNFTEPVEAVKETVAKIKEKEDVDMFVCLSHCGTSENKKKSEDEIMAREVPGLDLIVSGHSHTRLEEPLCYGDTYVVSVGEYGKAVGSLTMTRKENGRWQIGYYELIPTTEEWAADEELQRKIESFEKTIDTDYLSQYGYTAAQVLVHNNYKFSTVKDLEQIHTEHNLGNIMADAYVYAVENADGYDGVPVDLAVVPSGCVRDTYVQGNITVSDVFNSFSLGIGPDGVPGYPLVSVYLSGRELKMAAEIDASVSDYMTTARLYMSGMNMTYNPHRLILNKVTDVYLTKGDNGRNQGNGNCEEVERIELEDEKLYRVVADLYTGQMLSEVTDTSYGILSLVPKYADGTPVTDFEDCIVYDGGRELKAWVGIAKYLASFEKNEDGISEIPEYYNEMQDRKVVEDRKDIGSLIKSPNKYAVIIGIAVLVIMIVSVLIIVLLIKICRKIMKKRR